MIAHDRIPESVLPTVEPTPGMAYVWELVDKASEIFHRGRWHLLEESSLVDRADLPAEAGHAPRVLLVLEDLDPRLVLPNSAAPPKDHRPHLIRPVDLLVRARLREDPTT